MAKPYHPANLKHIPYGPKRVVVLAYIAKLFGIPIHIHGIPFGGAGKPACLSKNAIAVYGWMP